MPCIVFMHLASRGGREPEPISHVASTNVSRWVFGWIREIKCRNVKTVSKVISGLYGVS